MADVFATDPACGAEHYALRASKNVHGETTVDVEGVASNGK